MMVLYSDIRNLVYVLLIDVLLEFVKKIKIPKVFVVVLLVYQQYYQMLCTAYNSGSYYIWTGKFIQAK